MTTAIQTPALAPAATILAETFSSTGYHAFVQDYRSNLYPDGAFVVSMTDGTFTGAVIVAESLEEAVRFMKKLIKETETWEEVI
jgi:translation elongation factor P/translation initiation factor 5A